MSAFEADHATPTELVGSTAGQAGRGILLDIPRVRDVPWLEPGEPVWRDDLEAAERDQGVTLGEGDILLVRTGHARRIGRDGCDSHIGDARLHPSALAFVAERGVAAVVLDTAVVATADDVRFEALLASCERAGRWDFPLACAPPAARPAA